MKIPSLLDNQKREAKTKKSRSWVKGQLERDSENSGGGGVDKTTIQSSSFQPLPPKKVTNILSRQRSKGNLI